MAAKKPATKKPATPSLDYKPSLHVDGKASKKLQDSHAVGKKVKMVVTAIVAGHSVSTGYDDPKTKNHSTRLEIQSMQPHKPPKKK